MITNVTKAGSRLLRDGFALGALAEEVGPRITQVRLQPQGYSHLTARRLLPRRTRQSPPLTQCKVFSS